MKVKVYIDEDELYGAIQEGGLYQALETCEIVELEETEEGFVVHMEPLT